MECDTGTGENKTKSPFRLSPVREKWVVSAS